MKSWIHEIAESYVAHNTTKRFDLKENYRLLSEEQRLNLLYENMALYLDSQLENAYDLNIEDLNEEQLDEFFAGLKRVAGNIMGKIKQAGRNVAADYQKAEAEQDDYKASVLQQRAAQRRNKSAKLGRLGEKEVDVPDTIAKPDHYGTGEAEGVAGQAAKRALGQTKEVVGDNKNPLMRTGGGLGVGAGQGSGKGRTKVARGGRSCS